MRSLFKINDNMTKFDYIFNFIRSLGFIIISVLYIKFSGNIFLSLILLTCTNVVLVFTLLSILFSFIHKILFKLLPISLYRKCYYLSIVVLENFIGLPCDVFGLSKFYIRIVLDLISSSQE